jgi:Protein of unknown function (DUF1573)
MKFKSLLFIAGLSVLTFACKDRAAEKKIAELESKVKELQTQGTPASNTLEPVADQKPEGPLPVLTFETKEHNFGTIKEGDVVEYTFKFKNTGEAPLIIQSAQPSCGCTVPEWSKEPVAPGQEGYIKAKFDSNGKPNVQNKTITVTANTYPKQTALSFTAMVTPKADDSQGPLNK